MFPFKSVCKVSLVFQSESANEIDSDFGFYPSNRDDSRDDASPFKNYRKVFIFKDITKCSP